MTDQEPADDPSRRQMVFNIVEDQTVRHVETRQEMADQANLLFYVLTPDRIDVWGVPRRDADDLSPHSSNVGYRIEPGGVLMVQRTGGEPLTAYSPIGWLDFTPASGARPA